MNKFKTAALLAAAAIGGLYGYTRLVEKRSLSSWTVERLLALSKNTPKTEQEYLNFINKYRDISDQPYENPQKYIDYEVKEITVDDMQTFVWNDKRDPNQKVILYIHGGGYAAQPLSFQLKAVNHISKELDAKIVFPIYPKIPRYKYKDSISKMEQLYKDILSVSADSSKITIMGDSAGGGLALGLAYSLRDRQIDQPKDIILLSPWLDVTLNNPEIQKYEHLDPMLAVYHLKKMGENWADGLPYTKDPYVSPIYGNPKGLGRITMFVGTHEIFYPDVMAFDKKLTDLKIDHTTIVGEKMNHVYPVFPIAEAKEARREIVGIIKKK
ncbi:alpha/beta hydrolase fold domain-containing protein [Cytobacillus gottheilii]|uniref:alpha/beta hydrolase fold domain-containing protein n=1 Tax=Cytobacillus gottheilii TaxID=859144 RepID=UPI001593BB6C|nr:alpha/beta hydrolase [Cytobacillus gottheilii]